MNTLEKPDVERLQRQYVENLETTLSRDSLAKIDAITREFAKLNDSEKILCCLKMPTDQSGMIPNIGADDLSSNSFELNNFGLSIYGPSGNPLQLSSQIEQSQAYTWIMSHLEEDASTCLRKDEVYNDYRIYCEKHSQKPLNTADFGKVMKRAFPNVRPRRLGQRGQSKYCYGGLKKKFEVKPPSLPDLTLELTNGRSGTSTSSCTSSSGDDQLVNDDQRRVLGATGTPLVDASHVVLQYCGHILGVEFKSIMHLAQHLLSQRLTSISTRHALSLIAYLTSNQSSGQSQATFPSLSNNLLTPSAAAVSAFTEAVQRGVSGHLNRQALEALSSAAAASGAAGNNGAHKPHMSAQPSPGIARSGPFVKKEAADPNPNSPSMRVNSAGSANSSHSQPSPAAGTSSQHNQQSVYRSQQPQAAAAPAVAQNTSSTYQATAASQYHFSQFQSTSTPQALKPPQDAYSANTPSNYLAQQQQQQTYTNMDQRRASFNTNPYLSAMVGAGTNASYTLNDAASYAAAAAMANQSLNVSVGPFGVSYGGTSGGSGGGTGESFVAHSQQSQPRVPPPAPVAPSAGIGRSPYAAVPYRQPSSQQHPTDAPGAHEPITRIHPADMASPDKSRDFFSLASEDETQPPSGPSASTAGRQSGYNVSSTSAGTSSYQQRGGYYRRGGPRDDIYGDFSVMSPMTPCPSVGSSWQGTHRDPFSYDVLPHVGASPCPQRDDEGVAPSSASSAATHQTSSPSAAASAAPSRSTTQFYRYYDESGRQDGANRPEESGGELDRTLTNLSPEVSGANKSQEPLSILITPEESTEEVNMLQKREELHNSLRTPSEDVVGVPSTSIRDRYGQPHSDANGSTSSKEETVPSTTSDS